jgi:Zn-dependent protease with chaperone function
MPKKKPEAEETMSQGTRNATETRDQIRAALWPASQPPPTRVLICRHCRQKNRVPVPAAVFEPETCRCGACQGPIFFSKEEPLSGIASSAFEHSLDRMSLEALRSLPGFPALMRWMLSNMTDRSLRIQFMSSCIRCDELQQPELGSLLQKARGRIDYPLQPTLFLGQSPFPNAMTSGVGAPVVVVYTALLEGLDEDEMIAVLGHELGHLHANHMLYMAMAQILLIGGSLLFAPLRILTIPLQRALLKWTRCAELTADRAGLLASRDLVTALGVDMKLAGGSFPGHIFSKNLRLVPFIAQARELARMETDSWLDSFVSILITLDRTHPFAAWRVMHLLQWVEHGNYLDILSGTYERRPAVASM